MADSNSKKENAQKYSRSIFEAPAWSLWPVLSWIAYRDPDRMATISSRDALRAVRLYFSMAPTFDDPRPERTLSKALQSGTLQAIKNGDPLSAEAWFGKEPWSHGDVFFRRNDVLAAWPDKDAPSPAEQITSTGLPGRPSKSWHLIEPELRRRLEAGEEKSAAEWARVLIGWLKDSYPTAPRPAEKTITNKIRPILREHRSEIAACPKPSARN